MAAKPRSLAGTVAAVAHEDAVTFRKPAQGQARAVIRMVTTPHTLRAYVPRDEADEEGRACLSVPCPLRFLAHRRGGSVGSRGGVRGCPRADPVRPPQRPSWFSGRLGAMALRCCDASLELVPRQASLMCEACRELHCGHPSRNTPRGAEPCRVVAKTVPVSIMEAPSQVRQQQAGKESWARNRRRWEQPQRGHRSVRVELALQPEDAAAVVQEFGNRHVYLVVIVQRPARWLHMSQQFLRAIICSLFGAGCGTRDGMAYQSRF